MAQDPDKPKDDGKVVMPTIDEGMNKRPGVRGEDVPEQAKSEDQQEKDERNERARAKRQEQKILALARKRFKRCIEAESQNRAAALDDLKFKAGDQWPADVKAQRSQPERERPCLTINKIPSLTHQVTNDLRQNRPAINVSPIGDKSDKEGATAFRGMINAIERDCAADIAYDTAITSAADIGFGYARILTEYESSESFNRVVVIRRIRNAFTVYLDPERQEPDGADSAWGFITTMMPRDEYKEKYPDAQPTPWNEKGVGDELKEWITKDSIRIAEYFTLEHEMRRLVQLSNGHVGFYDDLADEIKQQVVDKTIEIIDERDSECQRIVWHKITALEILDTELWPGRWIPIVEFLGEEIDLQGKVIRSGLIRNAKDSQRMKNYWASKKTELVALAPNAPYIIAEGQDEGYEQEWKTANVDPLPLLHYVPVSLDGHPVPPPQRSEPPQVSSGIVQAEQQAEQDMMATTGVRLDPAVQELRYDESGKQMQEHRRNSDMGSFHLMDNASRSLRHIGRILVDLIPKVYDTKRVVTILQEDDTEERVTIDPTINKPIDRQPGARNSARKLFNPGMGTYGVTVTVGPSYATKRIEAQSQMMAFAKALPEKGQLIAHLIVKYSDWLGSDEAYRILAKALAPELLTPDIRDLPPQMQAFVQSLMKKMASLMAERMQMLKDLTDQKADRAVRKEKADKDFEAKLLKILADMRMHAMDFDQEMIQTAISATNEFHAGLAKQGFSVDNPQPDRAMLPVSPVNQPGTM